MKLVWSKFAKIKKIQKIPAQKSPTRFSSMDKQALADKAARKKFGEGSDFLTKQGMQTKSIRDVAVKDYARKVKNRIFFKTLNKELKASRLRTAGGIKGKKFKIKTPTAPTFKQQKAGIFKGSGLPKSKPALKAAKSKGADQAMKAAIKKSDKSFTKIVERYTGKAASDATKFKFTKRPLSAFDGEQAQSTKFLFDAGFDPPGYYKGMSRASRYDPLSRRKKIYRQQFKKKK